MHKIYTHIHVYSSIKRLNKPQIILEERAEKLMSSSCRHPNRRVTLSIPHTGHHFKYSSYFNNTREFYVNLSYNFYFYNKTKKPQFWFILPYFYFKVNQHPL